MQVGKTEQYEHSVEDAHHVPLNWDQLKHAAEVAGPDETIFIPGHVHMRVDKKQVLEFDCATVASAGATIEQTSPWDGDFLRLTDGEMVGLNLIGQLTQPIKWPGYGQNHVSRGVVAEGRSTVRNCRFSGWGHAGVTVGRNQDGSHLTARGCTFVDNPLGGLGYGINVEAGSLTAVNCYFDRNRHGVAGTGEKGCAWTVRNCVHGPTTRLHCFDMHAPGGESIVFENNTVLHRKQEAIRLRDMPTEGGLVKNNWFWNGNWSREGPGGENDAIQIYKAKSYGDAGVEVIENVYGERDPAERFPSMDRPPGEAGLEPKW